MHAIKKELKRNIKVLSTEAINKIAALFFAPFASSPLTIFAQSTKQRIPFHVVFFPLPFCNSRFHYFDDLHKQFCACLNSVWLTVVTKGRKRLFTVCDVSLAAAVKEIFAHIRSLMREKKRRNPMR
jgi:hypothetical protein